MVASDEAFEFYREGICAAFMPLRPECSKSQRQAFRAKVKSQKLDQTVLNIVSAKVHDVTRGKSEIAASPQDCVYLNLPLAGHSTISQNQASISLHSGELGLFDSSEPFKIDHGEKGTLEVASLMMPKAHLPGLNVSKPLVLSRHPVFGRTLTEAVFSLAQTASSVSRNDILLLLQLIKQLAPAASQQLDIPIETVSQRTAKFLRIKKVIRLNCSKQDFGLAQCSAIAGLSAGYIQQIFASHGTRFTAVLLEERLLLAERNTADGALRHLSIADVAYRSGFSDVSHFGRVFKMRFGVSRGVWRTRSTLRIH